VVKLADGKERTIRYLSATTYWSHDGRPITAQEFMEQLFGDLGTLVATEDELRTLWSDPDRREGFMQRLSELGYDADRLDDMRRLIDAPNSDIFDVLAYVRFTLAPLARSERADGARASGLVGYEAEMRDFLDYVLRAYEVHGVEELSPRKIADFLRIRYGGTNDAKRVLGSVAEIRKRSSVQLKCSVIWAKRSPARRAARTSRISSGVNTRGGGPGPRRGGGGSRSKSASWRPSMVSLIGQPPKKNLRRNFGGRERPVGRPTRAVGRGAGP
jgi:hypothetical protein